MNKILKTKINEAFLDQKWFFKKPNFHSSEMWFLFGFAFGLFAWQHIGRIYAWNFRPSTFLNLWVSYSETLWTEIGRLLAFIGSYYHYLYFYAQELVISVYELVNPLLRFVASPCYLIYGFLTTMATFAKPHLVLFGTFLLVVSGLGTMYWYYQDFFERPEVFASIILAGIIGLFCAIYANGHEIAKWINEAAEKLCPKLENPKKKPTRRSNRNSPGLMILSQDGSMTLNQEIAVEETY